MKIELPNIADQQDYVFKASTEINIEILKNNLSAPKIENQDEVDESAYPRTHLLSENDGFESPHPDIVGAYFRHFQMHFTEYNTDKKLAVLLGLSSDRRVREYKEGRRNIPYGVWRKFLVITGRVPQEVITVLARMS